MSSIGEDSQAIGDDLEATIFSDYIEQYIKNGLLTGIYLKEAKFGNLDDIVFELNYNVLHCIQAKGSKSRDEMTIGDFLNIKTGEQYSLFQKFYDSYKKIKSNFKEYNLELEFITNRFPSSSTRSLPKKGKKKISLASFIREVWSPFKNDKITWEKILEDPINQQFLKMFSDNLNISDNELGDFLKSFNFIFGYIPFRARSLDKIRPLENFFMWFLKTKKDPERKGYFSRDLLLKEFGLAISPNPHDFPVEREKYVSFPNLKDSLMSSISYLVKGYIFLQGGPSTGKSTFLESEMNLESIKSCIIFKYLCFREPNELSFRSRGELEHLLEDLMEQFKLYIKSTSIQEVSQRFTEDLKNLSVLAEQKSKKILIIIDGIDHIRREEMDKLTKPLTNFLPRPSALPKNIIFLISGQNFSSISWYESLKDTQECKFVSLTPFGINEIEQYVKKYYKYDESIDFNLTNKLFKKTQGNPRYLQLICKNFESYEDLFVKRDIIDKYINFDNDWDDLYEKYWISFGFGSDHRFKKLAGLISRIYGPIDLIWLNSWPEHGEIDEFISKFGFFFKKYSNILFIEHNSFKNYLQKKSLSFAGISIENEEKEFFNDLVKRCDENNKDSYSYWNKMIYLKKAEKIKDFIINREYFSFQWLEGRNLADIIEDFRILLEYYFDNNNIESTFKLLFLKVEFELREELNRLDTDKNPKYIFQINPIFFISEHHLIYLCANILHSLEVSPIFKIDFILYLIEQNILKENSNEFLLIKEYFRSNRQDWIKLSYNPNDDSTFTKKWLKVAYFFEKESDLIITDYLKFLSTTSEDYLMQGGKWRFFPILQAIGKFLIDNSLVDSLRIIYKILNDIITEDEWELIDSTNLICKSKYYSELNIDLGNKDPFKLILKLKYDEIEIRGQDYFENFLKENKICKLLFNHSILSKIFKIRCTGNISEEDALVLLGEDLTIDMAYSDYNEIKIKDRLFLYRYLHKNFGYDEEKIWLYFEKSYVNKPKITKTSLKMKWEYIFFKIAINLERNDLEKANILKQSILNLFEMFSKRSSFIEDNRLIVFANFELYLKIIIDEIKDLSFLFDWFQEKLFDFIKKNEHSFSNFHNQIVIIINIQKNFKKVNVDLVKWVINNIKIELNVSSIDYWNLSSIIYLILDVLELVKKEDFDYYKEKRKLFIDKLKILGFRLYPRKDYQIYNLIYLFKNIIHNVPKNDSNFIDNIRTISNILNWAEKLTEHSGISDIQYLLYESLLKWNRDLANEIHYSLNIHAYTPHLSNKKKEKIEFENSLIIELLDLLKSPNEFLERISIFLKGIREDDLKEQKESSINLNELFTKLDNNENVTFEVWKNLFKYLFQQKENKSLLNKYESFLLISFIAFYKEKANKKNLDQKDIQIFEIAMEKSFLKSPDDPYPLEISLERLYTLDKLSCFNYGWELFKYQFVLKRKIILHYLPYDYIMYTFLSKINQTNFRVFWNIYFKYLQDLFNLIDSI